MSKVVFILDGYDTSTYAVGCTFKSDFRYNGTGKTDFFSDSEISWVVTNYTPDEEEKTDFARKIRNRFDKTYEIWILTPDAEKFKIRPINASGVKIISPENTTVHNFVSLIKQRFNKIN